MRIEPTHFIEVWKGRFRTLSTLNPHPIYKLGAVADHTTVALFLIREKTPQEREKSIYYPKTVNRNGRNHDI